MSAEPKTLLGPTGLTGEEFEQGKVLTVWGNLKAHYAWDTGVGMGAYLAALKRGKILGVRCTRCDRTVVPARAFCERCFGAAVDFVELADTGTVNTFSIAHVSWDVKPLAVPELPAVIEIDGTQPRAGILHKLGEVKPEQVQVGMKVKAVWKPEAERTGSILDIRYFKPL